MGIFWIFACAGCLLWLLPQLFHVELCERPFGRSVGTVAIVLVECSLPG